MSRQAMERLDALIARVGGLPEAVDLPAEVQRVLFAEDDQIMMPDPRFEESLLQYAARCGCDGRDKEQLRRIHLHWHAELTRRYAGWVARSGPHPVRDESVRGCGEPGCCPSPDWMA